MGDSPTIRDVAAAAGVAIGTVSRVLNDHKSVSEDVRRRVVKALWQLLPEDSEARKKGFDSGVR